MGGNTDEQRVFGHFDHGNFTPMGDLERQGLLFRQLKRRPNDIWKFVGYAMVALFLLPFVALCIGFVYSAVGLFL